MTKQLSALAIIERARNMAYELYMNREGLEEDGERLSDLHNVLSAPPVGTQE
jgi:hypothetical protein